MTVMTAQEITDHNSDMVTVSDCLQAKDLEGAYAAANSAKERAFAAGVNDNTDQVNEAVDALSRVIKRNGI